MGRPGDIQFKGRKSTFMRPYTLAVEPDFCTAIYTVKDQLDASAAEVCGDLNVPAISAGAAVAVKPFHDPMRGHFDVLPIRVGKICLIEAGIRTGLKTPNSAQIKGGDAIVRQTQSRSQIAGLNRLPRRFATGQFRGSRYVAVQSHRHLDLKKPVLIRFSRRLPRFPAGGAPYLHPVFTKGWVPKPSVTIPKIWFRRSEP